MVREKKLQLGEHSEPVTHICASLADISASES